MDKVKTSMLICVILLGAGCSSPSKTTETNAIENASFVFNKKMECQNLQEKIEKDYNTISKDYVSRVTRVFYSPKMNSCLLIYKQSEKVKDVTYHTIYLEDFLNGKTILMANYDTLYDTDSTRYWNFDSLVREYE